MKAVREPDDWGDGVGSQGAGDVAPLLTFAHLECDGPPPVWPSPLGSEVERGVSTSPRHLWVLGEVSRPRSHFPPAPGLAFAIRVTLSGLAYGFRFAPPRSHIRVWN